MKVIVTHAPSSILQGHVLETLACLLAGCCVVAISFWTLVQVPVPVINVATNESGGNRQDRMFSFRFPLNVDLVHGVPPTSSTSTTATVTATLRRTDMPILWSTMKVIVTRTLSSILQGHVLETLTCLSAGCCVVTISFWTLVQVPVPVIDVATNVTGRI